MTLGLIVSLLGYIFLLPTLLNIFSSESEINIKNTEKSKITLALENIAKKFFFNFSIYLCNYSGKCHWYPGKLEVENSFINYFDKETEIYKGMKKIDDELGGTTPLNIILKFPVKLKEKVEDDEFSEWEEDEQKNEDKSKYWFTRDKMNKILKVHDYLELIARNWKSSLLWVNFKSCRRFKPKRITKFRNCCPI